MIRKAITGIVTGLFLISGVVAANANLLQNGNFDLVDGRTGLKGLALNSLIESQWDVYQSLPNGTDGHGGWTKGAGTAGIEIQYNTIVDAYSPNFYVELDSHGGMTQ